MDLSYAHASPHYLFSRSNTMPVNPNAPPGSYALPSGKDRNANMNASNPSQSRLAHSHDNTGSNYSLQSQPSSRSSDATAGTAHSTLFQPAQPPNLPGHMSGTTVNGGDVAPTDNIMNSVADASSSLFQVCVSLRQRLYGVPGFREVLEEEEESADEDTDPVTLLWRTFRKGYPLMLLYNALQPAAPLEIGPGVKADKRGKAATFKFLQACVNELKFPQEECFIVTDLYGDDTTGFAKVTRVVRRVLDILVQRGLIDDVRPTASDFEEAAKGMKRTQRQHIVAELVGTERTYVQHLEKLQAFKHLVEEKGIIPGDAVHDIFLNLNSLLDFQRRFLIKVEQTNALPEDEQNWGNIFVLYCEAFKVYEPYIANQKKCEKTVVAQFDKLKEAGGSQEMRQMVESSTALYGFLMKPFQRLSKYPLLLEDLYKKGDLDDQRKSDLMNGKEAATSVLVRTNHAVDREVKAEAVQELKVRVEDWKGHRVEGFGELLLYGTFTVVKGEGQPPGSKEGERQYHVYLFDNILLCCKDIDLSKPKNKLSNKQLVDKRGKPKLQLKGRIFMQNVTDLISLSKQGKAAKVLSGLSEFWQLNIVTKEWIFWKSDPSIDNFVIRFPTEEMMKKWASQIEVQRRKFGPRDSRSSHGSHRGGTSQTEFEFMRNQTGLENPYARAAEDEDEDEDAETLVGSGSGFPSSYGSGPYSRDFSQSRNGSQSSLRSRSTTGESGPPPASSSRANAPRFLPGTMPPGQPQLSVRTRELQQQTSSPLETVGESYFSPVAETPNSSRTSSSSQHMYPFPRQQIPPGQERYYEEGHGHTRFTAPAMARQRQPSGGGPPNGYSPNDQRGPVGVARPGPGTLHSAQNVPGSHRNRSASSPDIHNNPPRSVPQGPGMRAPGQPPVPDVPAGYQQHQHMIPRSQSNSPNLPNGMPTRGVHNTSPQYERQRQGGRMPPGGYSQEPSPTGYHQPQMGFNAAPRRGHGPSGDYPPPLVSQNSRNGTPQPPYDRAIYSPPPPQQQHQIAQPPMPQDGPTQLKVKVRCPSASQMLTLVVPMNISYQSLKDRIDAKLQRSTNLSLTERSGVGREGLVKLKYADEGDFVTILSDEDVVTAFEAWVEGGGGGEGGDGGMGEIELYCQ